MHKRTITTSLLASCFIVLLALPGYAATKFGLIYDIRGKAELVNPVGKSISLEKGKHILMPVRVGDRIKTGDHSKVIIVSLKGKEGYEISPNSEAKVEGASVAALSGGVKASRGYNVPSGSSSGPMAAMVFRGASNPDRCITPVSPVNTTIISNSPELSWGITCKDVDKVTVRIIEDGKVSYEASTSTTSLKVPAAILKYGHDYAWTVDAGPVAGRAESEFSILSESQLASVKEKMAAYDPADKDLAKRMSYVFFLIETDLKDVARDEVEKLKKEFPDNYYLKDI